MYEDAYRRGEAFRERIARWQRPMYVFAHHDDEIPTAGLMQRLGRKAHVVWTTNSDGLYFESDLQPREYAEVRKAEGSRSVSLAGVPAQNRINLDFSEVDIYRRLSELYSGRSRIQDVREYFTGLRNAVRRVIFEIRPDAVFTQAWQGGQPEHDLTHFFTMLAVRDLERETGLRPDVFHLPAYEYTILVAMRFHPMYRGERIRLRLAPDELAIKMKMVEAYPSQVRLFAEFEKVLRRVGGVARLFGGPHTLEQIFGIEEFGPVPVIDYTARPHFIDYFTYMFDDFEGVPVTFSRSIRPIVRDFL